VDISPESVSWALPPPSVHDHRLPSRKYITLNPVGTAKSVCGSVIGAGSEVSETVFSFVKVVGVGVTTAGSGLDGCAVVPQAKLPRNNIKMNIEKGVFIFLVRSKNFPFSTKNSPELILPYTSRFYGMVNSFGLD
jgi:hypothetical protein